MLPVRARQVSHVVFDVTTYFGFSINWELRIGWNWPFTPSIEEREISGAQDPLPTVLCDDVQLGQLFQNLLVNAIKFRGETPPLIHLSAECNGNVWTFSVRDNGIGIAPEYAERIFMIFQRLHSKNEYPGTGIGLAVCKKIVERHGGRIWVQSQRGSGATFFFTIPDRNIGAEQERRQYEHR